MLVQRIFYSILFETQNGRFVVFLFCASCGLVGVCVLVLLFVEESLYCGGVECFLVEWFEKWC